ncbi:hypothetical protein [Cohnella rhizosphaerae]|uniref:Uncharacterized protein n=1 Tax=Cohnella rhizosphaerae TaxID=1457232 RepID=A0A9X4KZB9_9BACL|nr:hypothetical protein [Cohnella rhizosphaerae]MDG0813588.1 hypothetical protein [Cohnella rhizosphaerae]
MRKRRDDREIYERALAFRKAALNDKELLEDDAGNPATMGGWNMFNRK